MEDEWEVNDVPGDVPKFGAIFMANTATKWECFKRKVFALPSSMADFVENIKEGMVLFLFEFEKRQLFGVYRATSDGSMNIAPHAFGYGKQLPAQVHFTPIWICSPLSENEFRDAIKENYFSAKKFHFGLSGGQVRRLLELFSTRKLKDKLPPRQFTRIVTEPAGKDRRRVDPEKLAVRERLKMELCEDDFTPTDMSESFENIPDRSIELDNNILFIDGRMESGKKVGSFGQNLLTDQEGDSMHKRKRVNVDKADIELYDTCTSLLPYRSNVQELSLDRQRISAASGRFLMAENTDYDFYNNLSPAMATKYMVGPYDVTGRADYRRPQGTNRQVDDDRFLMNDTMGRKLNFHNSFRPVIYSEYEENLPERPERTTNDCESFTDSRLGHKHHIDDDINLVVPSESFGCSLQKVKGTCGDALMGEIIASEHNLENAIGLDSLSEKFANPFDNDQRTIDERRYLMKDKMMKTNYKDVIHGSTTSYVPSGYDTSIQRQVADGCWLSKSSRIDNGRDSETYLQPVSTKYATFSHLKRNSLDCFRKPSQDSQFSQLKEPQNFKSSNSTYHDSVVMKTVSSAPELPTVYHGHTLSTGVDQGASLAVDTTFHGPERDSLYFTKSKSYDRKGSGRYDPPDFGNKNFYPTNYAISRHRTAQIPHSMEFISSAPADNSSLQLCPSTFGSVPFRDSHDLHYRKESLTSDSHPVLSKGFPKHIDRQAIDERYAGDGVLPSNENLTGFDIYHRERCSINQEVESCKTYESDIPNDGGQRCLNPEGGYSNSHPMLSKGFPKHMDRPAIDERYAGDRVLPSNENLTGFDIYHPEGYSIDHGVQSCKTYESDIPNDGGQHCLNPEVGYSDFEMPRKSVFTRLTSIPRVRVRVEPKKDSDLYLDTSGDEIMDILNLSQNLQMKTLMKFEHVDRQHDGMQFSPEHPQSTFTTKKMEEASQAIEEVAEEMPKETRAVEFKRRSSLKKGLDENGTGNSLLAKEDKTSKENTEAEVAEEIPKETRAAEFKRRSDLKKGLDENGTGNNVLAKEDNASKENTEAEGPVNKQQKRRKLVRPVFSNNVSVEAVTGNQNLLSQSQIA